MQTVEKTVLTAQIEDPSKPPKGERWIKEDVDDLFLPTGSCPH